jgi:DNA-directed RNA polymerase subunit RPC12/RpoP
MEVRGKLVELMGNLFCGDYGIDGCDSCKYNTEVMCSAYACADCLIANGATVQECGEWEEIEDDWNMETIYKCSACKEEFVTIDGTPADNLWNYCPHCGAKMMPQPPKGE